MGKSCDKDHGRVRFGQAAAHRGQGGQGFVGGGHFVEHAEMCIRDRGITSGAAKG